MSKIKIDVGRVKAEMAAKALSHDAAAAQLKVTRSYFDKILREGHCTAFTLGKIGRVLDIPIWELVDK